MEVEKLIGFYQTQIGIVDKIWGYFYSVTFVLLGATVLSKEVELSYPEISTVCIGYIIFTLGSAYSLKKAQGDLVLFANMVNSCKTSIKLNPITPNFALLFQGIIAGLVAVSTFCIFANRITCP